MKILKLSCVLGLLVFSSTTQANLQKCEAESFSNQLSNIGVDNNLYSSFLDNFQRQHVSEFESKAYLLDREFRLPNHFVTFTTAEIDLSSDLIGLNINQTNKAIFSIPANSARNWMYSSQNPSDERHWEEKLHDMSCYSERVDGETPISAAISLSENTNMLQIKLSRSKRVHNTGLDNNFEQQTIFGKRYEHKWTSSSFIELHFDLFKQTDADQLSKLPIKLICSQGLRSSDNEVRRNRLTIEDADQIHEKLEQHLNLAPVITLENAKIFMPEVIYQNLELNCPAETEQASQPLSDEIKL